MPLIIDCYNLLHQPMPPGLAGLDEIGLCRALERSGWARQGVTIVCDGAPKPHCPGGEPVPRVRVLYAGKAQAADPLIDQLVAADSAPRRLTVISDDRAVQRAAKRRKAQAMGCQDFIHLLLQALAAAGQIPPVETSAQTLATESDVVKRWAREFGLDPNARID